MPIDKIKPIRILHVVPDMNTGGLENLIMNLYRNIDRTKVQFDFLVHYKRRSFFDSEIEKLGGEIYRLSIREDNNIIKYIKDLNKFFQEHKEYKVIHGHMESIGFIYLGIAKKYKIPIRIAHSHTTSYLKTLKGYMKLCISKIIKYKANVNFACSTEAGRYLFGKKNNFEIIPNAIDIERFKYDEQVRKSIREQLGINDKKVIGNIGRFNLQKNHKFLLEIFKEIRKKDKNTVLLLVGNGELQKNIEQQIKDLELENDVKLLDVRNDIEKIYQAIDIFLLPSLFEGLPLVGIEAQTSKLACFFSDTITKEVEISNNVKFLSLKLSARQWANKIVESFDYSRKDVQVFNQEFDIKILAKKIENRYIEYNKNFKEN